MGTFSGRPFDAQKSDRAVYSGKSEQACDCRRIRNGGARPKILTEIDNEEWIIKFPSFEDPKDIGKQEYAYSLCAKECGIEMAETRLFPSEKCAGYFGTKRFDRVKDADGNEKKIHMLSVSAVLETSHRIPNLDYDLLMKLTLEITKNFSYLYDEENACYRLAPAYDLTYSNSLNGEHATTIREAQAKKIANDIKACVYDML